MIKNSLKYQKMLQMDFIQTKYNNDLAKLENDRLEKKKQKELENIRALNGLRIALIGDANEQEFAQRKFDLENQYADDLEKYTDNLVMKALLQEKYHKDLNKLLIENAKRERDVFADNIRSYASLMNAEFANIGANASNYIGKNRDIQQQLSDIKKEENALKESYNKRQIDYKEYNDKLLEISQKRQEKENELIASPFRAGFLDSAVGLFNTLHAKQLESLNKMQEEYDLANEHYLKAKEVLAQQELELEKLKEAEKTALLLAGEEERAEIEEAFREKKLEQEQAIKVAKESVDAAMVDSSKKASELMAKSLQAGVTAMASSFAQLKQEGASTQKALLGSLLAGLKAQIPIFADQIIGKSFAINPLLGVASIAALPILYAALGAAESAVSAANFFKGGYVSARNSSEYGIDNIHAKLTHGEFVINNRAVNIGRNKEVLEKVNRNNLSLDEYYKNDINTQNMKKVVEADKRLQKMMVKEFMISNQRLAKMNEELIKSNSELAEVNAHLEEIEASTYRLETSDFYKNINIDANIHSDKNAFIKEVEFIHKTNKRR